MYYDPLRYAGEKQKENLELLDKSTKTIHEIGITDFKFATNPKWNEFTESQECMRLKQVLPQHGHFFEKEDDNAKEGGCAFPVLQPFRRVDDGEDDDNPLHINATLEPWKVSTAAVVFQIRFQDLLSMLPGSDHILGEVVVPLATLIQEQQISGWFKVLEVGTKDFVREDEHKSTVVDESSGLEASKVFLTLTWSPPEDGLDTDDARETARETSIVIQEELLRWEATNRDKDKLRKLVIGRSIGAFKTVSGFAGTLQVIQNFLGKVVNTLEAVRNLLNFTVSAARFVVPDFYACECEC